MCAHAMCDTTVLRLSFVGQNVCCNNNKKYPLKFIMSEDDNDCIIIIIKETTGRPLVFVLKQG